ncbi:hypothetical protein [Rickettsia endosymbiont of Orchestes rusci]|uniref:hypothetical protein n=1 Tax=Rickettsia endosymbiont of Orchestes rusci TaxID=3066250 RepID=UPI00313C3D07
MSFPRKRMGVNLRSKNVSPSLRGGIASVDTQTSLRATKGFVAWRIIYRIMVIISTVSYRGPSHGIQKNLNKKTGCRGVKPVLLHGWLKTVSVSFP